MGWIRLFRWPLGAAIRSPRFHEDEPGSRPPPTAIGRSSMAGGCAGCAADIAAAAPRARVRASLRPCVHECARGARRAWCTPRVVRGRASSCALRARAAACGVVIESRQRVKGAS